MIEIDVCLSASELLLERHVDFVGSFLSLLLNVFFFVPSTDAIFNKWNFNALNFLQTTVHYLCDNICFWIIKLIKHAEVYFCACFLQQKPVTPTKDRDYRGHIKDQYVTKHINRSLSMSSIESTPTHYSHRSFVSLADFNLEPVDAGSSHWYETNPAGRDSGLNSVMVRFSAEWLLGWIDS